MLGSAFNPPHVGHLELAQEAHAQLGLSGVVLVPTGRAPHKQIESDPGDVLRVQMTRLAVEGDERLSVSELETGREGPSFMYRTLELLAEQRPDEELVLVLGADAAAGLESWRSPERILELARLGIAGRPGVDPSRVEAALAGVGGQGRAEPIEMPAIEVSSSMVRERVAAGRPIRYLVPDAVAGLIAERGLYRGADRRNARA